jgi:hypothetical protein
MKLKVEYDNAIAAGCKFPPWQKVTVKALEKLEAMHCKNAMEIGKFLQREMACANTYHQISASQSGSLLYQSRS